MSKPARHITLLIILCSLLLPIATTRPAPVTAASSVPTQWIAKIYTEALGRLPDQPAWQHLVKYFHSHGCSVSTLQQQGQAIYLSSEYTNLAYDNAAKLLTLYRGTLNREPDVSGFNANLAALNNGEAWSAMVKQFFTSSEFNTLVASICTTGSYSFGAAPAISIPLGQSCSGQFCFAGGTEAQLQSLLDQAPTGGTVYLDQQAIVTIDTYNAQTNSYVSLNIPSGVTLTTYGQPRVEQYALMGRLVRVPNFADVPVVQLASGARLLNIWVDGQRGIPSNYNYGAINIQLEGGAGTAVSNSRISNTAGWSSLQAFGTYEGRPCASNIITGNVVTVYSSSHYNQQWSDGLSIACENSDVENNQIVDATDVEIVLFRAYPAVQKSTVRNNTALSAGNPAFGGIVADPLMGSTQLQDFTGSSVDHNTLWTGPNTWFHIGLSVGTRPWFPNPDKGTGASFTYNTTGILTANVNTGIAVSGILNVNVEHNTLKVILGHYCSCPQVRIAAAISVGWASGNIQKPYTDVDVYACIG